MKYLRMSKSQQDMTDYKLGYLPSMQSAIWTDKTFSPALKPLQELVNLVGWYIIIFGTT